MPIVIAKCTECNSNLKVDTSKKAEVCEFCNNAFIVEAAIDNYVRNFDLTNNGDSVTNFHQATSRRDFEIVSGILKSYKGESEKVIIPQNVNEISEKSFYTLNVKTVVIPEGVKRIGSAAFGGCKYLNNIIIPESVEIIDPNAFNQCSSLSSVKLNSKMRNLPKDKYLHFIISVFSSTPFLEPYPEYIEYLDDIKKKQEEERRKERWHNNPNLCNACGGGMVYKGIINSRYVCKVCGRENYYTCRLCGGRSRMDGYCSSCLRNLP